MTRVFEPPPRATIVLPDAPERGPLVTPIDWSAGDRAIAQYFWTSTDKDSDAWTCDESEVIRVLRFGMKAQPVPHGTPNGHGHLTVHVERIPLPVAEQALRHRVQTQSPDGDSMGWLEWAPNVSKKSYRYARAKTMESVRETFQVPVLGEMMKQVGRPGAYTYEPMGEREAQECIGDMEYLYAGCMEVYDRLIGRGLAVERARFVLPTGLLTRMYLTASYRNWFNWLVQRNDGHAQLEIQQAAQQVGAILAQCCPITWGLWNEYGRRPL